MHVATGRWTAETGWIGLTHVPDSPQCILYFGATSRLEDEAIPVRELAARFPSAVVCGCSSAGEILGHHVYDESVVAAVIRFDSTEVRAVAESLTDSPDSRAVGHRAATRLQGADLRHVVVLSDGLSVNGTTLIRGFRDVLPPDIAITGGLAGDGARFQQTWVGLGSSVRPKQVVAVGFYGARFRVACGSRFGGQGFGPRRFITRSAGNTLFELDGQPALALYKRYLGERAAGLPGTGLLFPLELTKDLVTSKVVVRTILAVDEATQSITFAGDVPEGWYARLMKASPEQLLEGATEAGAAVTEQALPPGNALALVVSCVARRWVLGQRVEEELEAAIRSLPASTEAIGFYSYGEACPSAGSDLSELQNQSLTITVLSERGLDE